jgi:hypothetical protein
MSDLDMAQQLAAALNGHAVTSEDGDVAESDTANEESAPVEQTTEDDSAEVESTATDETTAPKAEESEVESDLAQDESGKRYVPQERFDKIYGKAKATERELAALRQQVAGNSVLNQVKPGKGQPVQKIDKADILELKMALPQFNSGSTEYDEDLDTLGLQILRANPGITPLQAGHLAIDTAKRLAGKANVVRDEARAVKSLQSDQGITSRVVSRTSTEPDVNKMSASQMESYMKSKGMW